MAYVSEYVGAVASNGDADAGKYSGCAMDGSYESAGYVSGSKAEYV